MNQRSKSAKAATRGPLSRIAVLNRGEAATRCLRGIRELRAEDGSDLVGIALYTEPDQFSPFVREADEAQALGPALRGHAGEKPRVAYVDQDRVLAALRAVRADAVWPGWGFLAEDAAFVERLEAAGLTFLGPRSETVRALGDKLMAKRLAESASVPVLPWSGGTVSADDIAQVAEQVGFPLMVKAAAGGGGRGIRRVTSSDQLAAAFASARSEAAYAFGDDRIFLEACATQARHVEVQIAADAHGRVLALGLRDCSVQRNHQKVVEEAPPPGLAAATAREMKEASIRLAQKVGYLGVGTVEYLVAPDGSFAFLEVNPRLQVEHGVTETLCDCDLVKWQIRIARGEDLPDEAPEERGAAIEVRICAEDPSAGFLPSPGRIELLELPAGPGIRVDSGVASGDDIPSEFDSMVAKVIARGATRDEARARLERAVLDLRAVVAGGMINKGFLLDILRHRDFRAGEYDTGWLGRVGIAAEPAPIILVPLIAAILSYQRERAATRFNFFAAASRGRPRDIPPSTGVEIDLVYGGEPYRFRVFAIGGWIYRIYLGERVAELSLLEAGPHSVQYQYGNERGAALFSETEAEIRIEIDGRLHRVERDSGGKVRAPAPGLVIAIAVAPGDTVQTGQRLGLLEAMKTETAFLAPVSGVVREVSVRPGERVAAGDVLLTLEPSTERARESRGPALEIPLATDPLDLIFDEAGDAKLSRVSEASASAREATLRTLTVETRRVLMGYDVNPSRAERIMAAFAAPLDGTSELFRAELAKLATAIQLYTDIDRLFSRAPSRINEDQLGPSNDARMAMYLRRIEAEGSGIAREFLDELRRTLRHYDIPSLAPSEGLYRALLRMYATRTTLELRNRLVGALLHLLIRLVQSEQSFERIPELRDTLDAVVEMRGTLPPGVCDLGAQVRFLLFERPNAEDEAVQPAHQSEIDLSLTMVPPPDEDALAQRAASLELTLDEARRIELWRLDGFDLERVETFPGIYTFHGQARDNSGDERLFCFAEVDHLGPNTPHAPDLQIFEACFHEAIEGLRSLQAVRDPEHRLHWSRLCLFVRPPIVMTSRLLRNTVRRLSPETGALGLEKVLVRFASVDPNLPEERPQIREVVTSNPTGSHVETTMRNPHHYPLAPATSYERRVAAARMRGLIYPYELVRLFTAAPAERGSGPAALIGPGAFVEYDFDGDAFRAVSRPPGENVCGVVVGLVTSPTVKYPEGMRRVLVLGDSTYGMGALAAPECARIVAAIELAREEGLPVEWVALSSGARIALDSGTENLDATARVVRAIVQFTDAGGEINVIVPGVNVGAQSYFDALATMGLQSRGILIMLPSASMVLTGRAALEFSGAVAAEDEVGIGGYERIMGPSGQAHHQARSMADAYRILLEHYACSYRAPGESSPRRFKSRDPVQRDVTAYPYEAPNAEYETVGEIFSAEGNPERKRPFAMRPLMQAIADQDGGHLERWRGWNGAETAIVWDAHLGGHPICMIGIESQSLPRVGNLPNDGPDTWTAGTLFPLSSKKIARALNAASGNRPAIILANLSGFDGSPESMRRGILEFGAEIARAVVRFDGPLLFNVVSRYHGGAYVVFSRELNDQMRATALAGSFASVIGGPAAAAVVFPRDVRRRANTDPRVLAARERVTSAHDGASRITLRAELERIREEVRLEKQSEVAAEFDAVHSVERALEVGSIEAILEARNLRSTLIRYLTERDRSPIPEN